MELDTHGLRRDTQASSASAGGLSDSLHMLTTATSAHSGSASARKHGAAWSQGLHEVGELYASTFVLGRVLSLDEIE